MAKPDFGGARGSSAGDDFHEWWALRHALPLLSESTDLVALTVEGLIADDELGTPSDAWLGVDCTQYFGGDQLATATKVVVEQLKYSSANPELPWTLARLQSTTNTKKNNSVIARLASAYAALAERCPNLAKSNGILIRLVSNQPIASEVIEAISKVKSTEHSALQKAAKIKSEQFPQFLLAVDFSLCGGDSRFAHEEKCVSAIADVVSQGALSLASDLKARVHKLMLPEGRGSAITKETLLSWLGVAHPDALFPCPPQLRRIDASIPRQVSKTVLAKIISGNELLCLHGGGGCGKTTTLQQIQQGLPQGSMMLIFDCYGAGRYQEAGAYRHRTNDAYMQLINELAGRLQTPIFISRSDTEDKIRLFQQRLALAALTIQGYEPSALLVIAVDAVDNSIEGARQCSPPEVSFVHEFLKIRSLPKNVRILITARTSRLPDLRLPDTFKQINIEAFTKDETKQFVSASYPTASDQWVEDFHALSRGIPRVQSYAFQYASTTPVQALEFLRPNGKNLDEIFRARLREAVIRDGNTEILKSFCAALIGLPRPIPAHDLAQVTKTSKARVLELCAEMSPGLQISDDDVSFADEDFESFVRDEAQDDLPFTNIAIADHFMLERESNPYAATHLAGALFATNRGGEIVQLVESGVAPTAIVDMVLRREAQNSRQRIAMKVCRASGDTANAILILLIGAEALKVDEAVKKTLTSHPDLAVTFARQTVNRTILYQSSQQEHHGPALMHLMAVDSRIGDGISVREKRRQISEWFERRSEDTEYQKSQGRHPHAWQIESRDIAAFTEGVLRLEGPAAAIRFVQSWTPRSVGFKVALSLTRTLIMRGDAVLVEHCANDPEMPKSWQCLLLVPLALSGYPIDSKVLEASLTSRAIRNSLKAEQTIYSAFDKPQQSLAELVLTGCEILIARGAGKAAIILILRKFLKDEFRDCSRSYQLERAQADISLRSFALLEHLSGRVPTVDSYLIVPQPAPGLEGREKQRADSDARENLKKARELVLDRMCVYEARARALLGLIPPSELVTQLRPLISRFVDESWRSRSYEHGGMTVRMAHAMANLTGLPGNDPHHIFLLVKSTFKNWETPFGLHFESLMTELSMVHALHDSIIENLCLWAKAARQAKTASSEKIEFLVGLARVLGSISPADGQSLFNSALAVADEVDGDSIHELALLSPLAERAALAIEDPQRRQIAKRIHLIVDEVYLRLLGYDHFPWDKVGAALSALSIPLALAAVGCWDDEATIDQNRLLPGVVKAGLRLNAITSEQAMALTYLDDDGDVSMLELLASKASSPVRAMLSEEIAKEELRRFAVSGRPGTVALVRSLLGTTPSGPWINQLIKVSEFNAGVEIEKVDENSSDWKTSATARVSELETLINLTDFKIANAAAITSFLEVTKSKALAANVHFSATTVLAAISRHIGRAERPAFLKAFGSMRTDEMSTYDWRTTIIENLKSWLPSSTAVQEWFRTDFKKLVVSEFHVFGRYLSEDFSDLEWIFGAMDLTDEQATALLMEGIEQHSDVLTAPGLYSFVGYAARYITPLDAAKVLDKFTARLRERFPNLPIEHIALEDDEPVNSEKAVARLLYGFLGDIDHRMRWRAAHGIRCLARLGDSGTLYHVIQRYEKLDEPFFKNSKASFYWCAARMWLMLSLERISSETPAQIIPHTKWLLDISADKSFPHLLIRQSIKNTLQNVARFSSVHFSPLDLTKILNINESPFPRVTKSKIRSSLGGVASNIEKRFRFDSMDTIPYWFRNSVDAFADMSMSNFLIEAERWIVDMWGVTTNTHKSVVEPRQDRLRNINYSLLDHRHGTIPTIEGYRTHLEWHAMWCATGALLQHYPLNENDQDSWDTLENWIDRNSVAQSGLWISDIRQCKPLDRVFWSPPDSRFAKPVEKIDDQVFLSILNISESGCITAGAYFGIHTQPTNFTCRLSTALVSSVTASALLRVLQITDNAWNHYLPPAGHDSEINDGHYCLKGWLDSPDGDMGLDESDSFRNDVRKIECAPSLAIFPSLIQVNSNQAQPLWMASDNKVVFSYQAWGDIPSDKREKNYYYATDLKSEGWRLLMDATALNDFLTSSQMDLVVKIQITHEKRKDDNYRYEENTEEKARFTKILILRRGGSIESADQHIGSWFTPN